jgi:2,3-bisphosphoglycerate-independent phosphoglycerate mutase
MESLSVNNERKYGQVAVLVWDGFGLTEPGEGNAAELARMNTWHALCKKYKLAKLDADGVSVGLPPGMPGNSEAGHSTIGAGRAIESDLVIINKTIENKTFEDNPALLQAAAYTRRNKSTLHLMGLLTNHRSGHAYPEHLFALLEFVERLDLPRVALHLFTDGRDTPPYHAVHLLQMLKKRLPKNAVIASIVGRYYAMDRNRNWNRTALAYHAIANGEGVVSEDPVAAITESYNRGASDEFVLPTVICEQKTCVAPVRDKDAIIYWNLRSDRARQLVKPFVLPDFESHERDSFKRHAVRKHLKFVTLTEFGSDLDSVLPAFPHREVPGTIVEALRYKHQVYVAESEKYSQVTYFLNGGYDRPRFDEERIRVQSQRVARYDSKPDMRANEIARRIIDSLENGADMVLANFANADMVGHTGNLPAAIHTCEALDDALAYVWNGVDRIGGTLIVTSDHGNVEVMRDVHGGVDTEHNANPVPFLVAGKHIEGKRIHSHGTLADVAPTVLKLLGVEKPKEMKGRSLL